MRKYVFEDKEFTSLSALFQELKSAKGILKMPGSADEWASLGVSFVPDDIEAIDKQRLDTLALEIRTLRDEQLKHSDFAVSCPDVNFSEEEKQEIIAYRKVLRELPKQEGFPTSVKWPEIPERLKKFQPRLE